MKRRGRMTLMVVGGLLVFLVLYVLGFPLVRVLAGFGHLDLDQGWGEFWLYFYYPLFLLDVSSEWFRQYSNWLGGIYHQHLTFHLYVPNRGDGSP